MGISVLVIEPDSSLGNNLKELFTREGFEVVLSRDLRDGVVEYKKSRPPIVYMGMPTAAEEGIRALREFKSANDKVCVIVAASHPSIQTAVETARMGVATFLEKPFQSQSLLPLLRKAVRNHGLEQTPEAAVKRIGRTIRDLRKEKGLTLRQVGGRVGLSYSMISKVELGDCDPPITTLIKIAKALDVELCRLFPDSPPCSLPPSTL